MVPVEQVTIPITSDSDAVLSRSFAEVNIRRYRDLPDCDVVVSVRGRRLIVTCPTYEKALSWAKLECRSYRLPPVVGHAWFTVTPNGAVEAPPPPVA